MKKTPADTAATEITKRRE